MDGVFYLFLQALEAMDRLEEGVECLEQALSIEPKNKDTKKALAKVINNTIQ